MTKPRTTVFETISFNDHVYCHDGKRHLKKLGSHRVSQPHKQQVKRNKEEEKLKTKRWRFNELLEDEKTKKNEESSEVEDMIKEIHDTELNKGNFKIVITVFKTT